MIDVHLSETLHLCLGSQRKRVFLPSLMYLFLSMHHNVILVMKTLCQHLPQAEKFCVFIWYFYLQITLPRCALIFQRLIYFCSLSMKQRLFILWVLLLFLIIRSSVTLLDLFPFLMHYFCVSWCHRKSVTTFRLYSGLKGSTWFSSLYFSILLPEILSSLMNSGTIDTLLLFLVLQLSIVYTLILFYYFCNQQYDKNRQIMPAKLPGLFI